MTWLTPYAGLFLALAVIPPLIVLYFLKLRRKPQAISCTILWKRSVEDLRANAPFQRLRKSLLLFLQLLALLLLAAAVTQPQIQAGSQAGGKRVFLIDNSASMSAIDGGRDVASGTTRLDEVKRRARERIEALYGGGLFGSTTGETMIIAFSDRAEILCRFTDSKQQLMAAIDSVRPTHGETRIAEALKLARAYTTNVVDEMGEARPTDDPPILELFSDGRVTDLGEQVLRGEPLSYHAVGRPEADNLAISGISVERPYDRPAAVEVFAAVLNFNQVAAVTDLQLSVNDTVRGVQEVSIQAAEISPSTGLLMPGRANVVFTPFDQPRDAVIEVAIIREDALAADNVAHIVVPPPKQLVLAIVAQDFTRSILLRALEGMTLQRLEQMSPQRYESLATQGGLDGYDVIVMENYKPAQMPPGRYLTFGPTPPIEGLHDFGEGESQIILSGRDEHPALRFVTHDSLFMTRFRLLQQATDVQVLLEGSRGPAMVAVSRGPLQVIHCPFDPLETNWPFQRSFVTFIVNAVDYLGHAGQGLTSRSLKPGEALTARLPANATGLQISTPTNSEPIPLDSLDPTQLAWGPIELSGLHVLSWRSPDSGERQSRAFAVNLLSEAEGHIAMNQVLEIGSDVVDARETARSAYTPLWPWAIGVCLAVLMVEWWVYHRKAYV